VLGSETRTELKGVITATLASALFKRCLRNRMVQDVHPLGAPASANTGCVDGDARYCNGSPRPVWVKEGIAADVPASR
jgi:hypothetical protein